MARRLAERGDLIPVLGETFREHGYSGTSLSLITARTGLGKGSLYHYFPGGKEEMAQAVLDDVASWFAVNVFRPLRDSEDPGRGIDHMFEAVAEFFHSGRRVCLVGSFALDSTRDHFVSAIRPYFSAWVRALAGALKRQGFETRDARETAEEIVAGIQGALVLARAQEDASAFMRIMKRLRRRTRTSRCD